LVSLVTLVSLVLPGTLANAALQSVPNALHTAVTSTVGAAQSGQAQMKTVACPTPQHCLAIGAASSDQGVISYSNDAGKSWSPVEVFDPNTILSLNALVCPSTRECVAVGASLEHRGVAIVGRVSKGKWNWSAPVTMANETSSPNPPTVVLNSVACVSINICVAVGTDLTNSINVTTYTTNAGQTWTPVAVAAGDGASISTFSSLLNSVSCDSPTSCVAVGSDAAGHAIVTYGSFSSGKWSWSATSTQLPGDGNGGYLESVNCYNVTTCVAVGADTKGQGVSTVGRLTSSGWTWTSESIVPPNPSGGGKLLALNCSSTGSCLAVGVDSNSQSIGTRSLLGGQSWTSDVSIANDGATNSTRGNDPSSVACANATHCLTVGTDSLGRAFYSTSTNRGLVWHKESLFDVAALPGQGPLASVSCSTQTCVAVGTNDLNQSVVSRSTDAGHTWRRETKLVSDPSGASYAQGVSCVDSKLCVVVGWDSLSRSISARSVNGGRTWSVEKSITVDFSGEGFLSRVSCSNIHRCVAVGWDGEGQAITTHSFNGGVTWSRETTVTSDKTGSGFLYAIDCPSIHDCVAVGRDDQFKGVAAYSTNGGVGWSALRTLVSVTRGTGALSDVSCPTTRLCIGVGGTGTGAGASVVSRSLDGGKTWTPETTVALDSTGFGLLSSVSCPSLRLCVASGTDGFEQAVTTYSFDQGLSWSREAATTSASHKDFLTGVSCSNVIVCVAVGADAAQRGVTVPIRFAATVTFSGHGAKGVMKPQRSWTSQRLAPVAYTRPGYHFEGWSLTPNGPVRYHNDQGYNFLANVKLFAVWARA
jgi:hypothetical protein